MQSGRNWLGFGDSPQAGPSIWDLASRWGKGKAADKAASMAMTAIGGPSAGIAAEAGKDLLPQLFASLFNKGGEAKPIYASEGMYTGGISFAGPLSEVKYKKTGGNVSDEITLKMAPLFKGE